MPYDYTKERHNVFTDEGQKMFLKIRDRTQMLIKISGACTIEKIIDGKGILGDTFIMLACIDRLEELGEIRKIHRDGVSTQRQIYTS